MQSVKDMQETSDETAATVAGRSTPECTGFESALDATRYFHADR